MGADSETHTQKLCGESKLEVSIVFFPLKIRQSSRRGGRKIVGVTRDGGHLENMPTEATKLHAYAFIETEMGSMGPLWVCPRSSVYML